MCSPAGRVEGISPSSGRVESVAPSAALCSPLRPRELNPVGFDAKVSFWRQEIVSQCRNRGSARVCGSEVVDRHTGLHGQPQCIEQILHILKRQGELIAFDEFRSAMRSRTESWSQWAVNVTTRRFPRYLWQTARDSMFGAPPILHECLVCVPALQVLSDHLRQRFSSDVASSRCSSVLCEDHLYRRYHSEFADFADFQFALHWLHQLGHVTVEDGVTQDDPVCVKLRPVSSRTRPVISTTERARVRLTIVIDSLVKQCCQNEQRRAEVTQRIKQFQQTGNSRMVRWSVRQLRVLTDVHDKFMASLQNLQSMVLQVEQSETNQQVFDALKEGSMALKSVREDLSLEKVEATMSEISELVEWGSGVSRMLSSDCSPGGGQEEDTEDLERELARLLLTDVSSGNLSDSSTIPPMKSCELIDNSAETCPLTPEQRPDLYQSLEHCPDPSVVSSGSHESEWDCRPLEDRRNPESALTPSTVSEGATATSRGQMEVKYMSGRPEDYSRSPVVSERRKTAKPIQGMLCS